MIFPYVVLKGRRSIAVKTRYPKFEGPVRNPPTKRVSPK